MRGDSRSSSSVQAQQIPPSQNQLSAASTWELHDACCTSMQRMELSNSHHTATLGVLNIAGPDEDCRQSGTCFGRAALQAGLPQRRALRRCPRQSVQLCDSRCHAPVPLPPLVLAVRGRVPLQGAPPD